MFGGCSCYDRRRWFLLSMFLLKVFSEWKFEIFVFENCCRDWGRRFMRLYEQYTSWDNPKDPHRPLVIGYISPDYFTHSVSYFIEAPVSHHDYANCKVVVYSAVVKVLINFNIAHRSFATCNPMHLLAFWTHSFAFDHISEQPQF